jgi:3-hydroxyisobutyrate dehydrogenase
MRRDRVGFVGLGQMGAPVAARLAGAPGPALVVHDADPAAVARFTADHDASAATSPADLAASCATVVTMLPTGAVVRSVVWEAAGACRDRLQPGDVVVDMSSSAPDDTAALGALLRERGVALVDAPVSGGVRRALAGSLAVLLGGDDPAAVARARALLAPVGTVIETGGLGSGHTMKALNNLLSAAGLAATAEVLSAGIAAGLDPDVVLDVLNASSGRNNSTETKIAQYVYSGSYGSGFALGLMVKDLRLAAGILARTGTPGRIAATCLEVWTDAERELPPGADHTRIAEWLGVPARTGPAPNPTQRRADP